MGVITGIGISYAADRGAHPLTGKRAPDVRLADGSRLYEALRTGRFVLITPTGPEAPDAPSATDPRVIRTAWTGARRTTLLVRPDGYIAWASEQPDPAGLGKALAHWAGPAA
jgi:hypothetical protein